MAAQTFLQLYTDALSVADESTGSGSSNARTLIKQGINEFYSEIAAARDWETLKNNTTIGTSSGTMEYTPITSSALVPRIRRIVSLVDETNNQYLEEVTEDQFKETYPYIDITASANQGNPRMWFPSGYNSNNDIKLKAYPVPNASLTLRLTFYEEPVALSADTDKPRIPDQFHYGLEYGGLAKYFEFQKDPIATYWRQQMENFKQTILNYEYGPTDEMPEMMPQGLKKNFIIGKIGRIYNR